MKKSLFALALLLIPSAAYCAEYEVDPDHTKISFKVRHLGLSWVPGEFSSFKGTFSFDEKDISGAKAQAKIQTESVDTGNAKRDTHLKGDDFFNAPKFPEISFVTKEVKNVKGNKFTVLGDLSIHGVTKPVELDAEFLGVAKDPWGNERAAFQASTVLNRKDFGLEWNKTLDNGGLVVGNEVKVTIDVEGIKKKS